MSDLSMDAALDRLQSEAAKLSRPQAAAFFAICERSLFPLYEDFVHKNGWGDPAVLRAAEAHSLSFATGHRPDHEVADRLLQEIADVIPDGEKFDPPESTFAQDVAICMDAAVRASDPQQVVNPAWVQYVLEPATVTVAEKETGSLDPGSGEQGELWRMEALRDPT